MRSRGYSDPHCGRIASENVPDGVSDIASCCSAVESISVTMTLMPRVDFFFAETPGVFGVCAGVFGLDSAFAGVIPAYHGWCTSDLRCVVANAALSAATFLTWRNEVELRLKLVLCEGIHRIVELRCLVERDATLCEHALMASPRDLPRDGRTEKSIRMWILLAEKIDILGCTELILRIVHHTLCRVAIRDQAHRNKGPVTMKAQESRLAKRPFLKSKLSEKRRFSHAAR